MMNNDRNRMRDHDEDDDENNSQEEEEEYLKKLNISLAINRAYQEVIDEKIAKLEDLLQKNLAKQVNWTRKFLFPVFKI